MNAAYGREGFGNTWYGTRKISQNTWIISIIIPLSTDTSNARTNGSIQVFTDGLKMKYIQKIGFDNVMKIVKNQILKTLKIR